MEMLCLKGIEFPMILVVIAGVLAFIYMVIDKNEGVFDRVFVIAAIKSASIILPMGFAVLLTTNKGRTLLENWIMILGTTLTLFVFSGIMAMLYVRDMRNDWINKKETVFLFWPILLFLFSTLIFTVFTWDTNPFIVVYLAISYVFGFITAVIARHSRRYRLRK